MCLIVHIINKFLFVFSVYVDISYSLDDFFQNQNPSFLLECSSPPECCTENCVEGICSSDIPTTCIPERYNVSTQCKQ